MIYMAKAPSTAKGWDPSGSVWFKVSQPQHLGNKGHSTDVSSKDLRSSSNVSRWSYNMALAEPDNRHVCVSYYPR